MRTRLPRVETMTRTGSCGHPAIGGETASRSEALSARSWEWSAFSSDIHRPLAWRKMAMPASVAGRAVQVSTRASASAERPRSSMRAPIPALDHIH